MKSTQFLFLLFSLLTTTTYCQTTDWQPLFNGKNLDGWTRLNGTAEYRMENQELIGVSTMNSPNSFLCTDKKYGDFILEAEVKLDPALNTGIQFRSQSLPTYQNGRVHGYQLEIDPSPRSYTGGIYDEGRRAWLCPLAENPLAMAAFKRGDWNKLRIEAIGNTMRTWVNGVQTASLEDDWTTSGFIAIQVHSIGNQELAGKEIRFRNLRIATANLEVERWQEQPQVAKVNLLPNTISESERRQGWRLLWDGKTSEGWRSARSSKFPEKGWKMENGALTVLSSGGSESNAGGDIISTQRFSNFELSLEFRITEGANSGVKYLVQPDLNKGEGSAIGPEFQILDDAKHPDAALGVNGNRKVGALYDLIPANNISVPGRAKDVRGIGEWNHARIVVRDNHVEHWLNTFKVVEYERNTPMFRALVAYSKYKIWEGFGDWAEGHILLQDHGNEVSFRSIKIREF